MKFYLIFLSLLFSFVTQAKEKTEHREHGAHVHGSAELSIAFDGNAGKVEFKSPSDSILGFEHPAKSAADKKIKDEAFKKFEENISEMIRFDKNLNCQIKKDKIEVLAESDTHSDLSAAFTIKCEKSPLNTKITFNFQKFFPRLQDIDTQIIVDSVQKSIEIKSNGTSLELK
ncbi:MAG: ZrgA family zinc uptake protein [Pseudobdellovibrionaceae bacterium]